MMMRYEGEGARCSRVSRMHEGRVSFVREIYRVDRSWYFDPRVISCVSSRKFGCFQSGDYYFWD